MAGGKGSTFDNDLLKLIFNGISISNLADNAATAPLTNLYASLHTADPGAGGSQTTNEATYGSYARVTIARTSGGFTVSGNSCSLASTISFPVPSTGAGEIETWFAIGTAVSGAGKILYRGPITPSITIVAAIAPQLTAATTITES